VKLELERARLLEIRVEIKVRKLRWTRTKWSSSPPRSWS